MNIPFCQHTATAKPEPGDTQLPKTVHVPFHGGTKGKEALSVLKSFAISAKESRSKKG